MDVTAGLPDGLDGVRLTVRDDGIAEDGEGRQRGEDEGGQAGSGEDGVTGSTMTWQAPL